MRDARDGQPRAVVTPAVGGDGRTGPARGSARSPHAQAGSRTLPRAPTPRRPRGRCGRGTRRGDEVLPHKPRADPARAPAPTGGATRPPTPKQPGAKPRSSAGAPPPRRRERRPRGAGVDLVAGGAYRTGATPTRWGGGAPSKRAAAACAPPRRSARRGQDDAGPRTSPPGCCASPRSGRAAVSGLSRLPQGRGGHHPDLHRLAPEGAGEQIRLGQVQQLAIDLSLTAMEGRFRMAVISSAHRLNPDAQNALLKTLEEPAPVWCSAPTTSARCCRPSCRAPPACASRRWARAADRLARRRSRRPPRASAAPRGGRPPRHRPGPHAPAPGDAGPGRHRPHAAGLARGRPADAAGARPSCSAPRSSSTPRCAGGGRSARLSPWSGAAPSRRSSTPGATSAETWPSRRRDRRLCATGPAAGAARLCRTRRSPPARFLDRLDRLGLAVDAYASPELVLDALLLAWPRRPPARGVARRPSRARPAGPTAAPRRGGRPWGRPGRRLPLVRRADGDAPRTHRLDGEPRGRQRGGRGRGPRDDLEPLVAALRAGPSGASVSRVDIRPELPRGRMTSFAIRSGAHRGD